MKTILDYYKETAKKYGVTDERNVSPVEKLTFAQAQVMEQRRIINRLLFDISITKSEQEKAKDEKTKDAYRKKIDDYQSDLSQLSDSVQSGIDFIAELRTEYKELQVED